MNLHAWPVRLQGFRIAEFTIIWSPVRRVIATLIQRGVVKGDDL